MKTHTVPTTICLSVLALGANARAGASVSALEVAGWFNDDPAQVASFLDKSGCTLKQTGSGFFDNGTKSYPQNGRVSVLVCGDGHQWTHKGVGLSLLFTNDGKSFLALSYRCPNTCTQIYSIEKRLLFGSISTAGISVSDFGPTTVDTIGRLPTGELTALSTGAGGVVMKSDGGRCEFKVTKLHTMRKPPVADIAFDSAQPDCSGIDVSALSRAVVLPTFF
jgi:hypothetical protein